MDQITLSLLSGVIGALLGALLVAFLQSYLHQKYDQREQKRDVLTRFVGNRHFLTGPLMGNSSAEPYISLNEIFIVFADSPSVISALKKFHQELNQPGRLVDNILTLTKEMATASDVRIDKLNDDFISRPFTPPSKAGSEKD